MLTDAFLDSVLASAASIEVTDGGENRAGTVIVGRAREGQELVFSGEFDADFANFDWRVRRVLLEDGTVIDEEQEDMGRKASPSVWNLEIRVAFGRLEA